MDAPTLTLGGLVFREPVTVATDLLLAGECAAFWALLRGGRSAAARDWARFFLFVGVATLLGAFKHAAPGGATGRSLLLATQGSDLAAGLSATFAGLAALRVRAPAGRLRTALDGALAVQLLAFVGTTLVVDAFLVVVVHTATILLVVMGTELVGARRGRPGSAPVLLGLALNIPSAAVYLLDVSPNVWVDRNGIAHGFMMLGLPLIHRGALQADRAAPRTGVPGGPSGASPTTPAPDDHPAAGRAPVPDRVHTRLAQAPPVAVPAPGSVAGPERAAATPVRPSPSTSGAHPWRTT